MNGNMTMGGAMDPTTPQSTPTSYYGMCMACFRMDSYKRYFDVDTDDIKNRILAAMTHFHQPQYFRDQVVGPEVTNMSMNSGPVNTDLKGPDLYGPVWITFVLILLVAVRLYFYCVYGVSVFYLGIYFENCFYEIYLFMCSSPLTYFPFNATDFHYRPLPTGPHLFVTAVRLKNSNTTLII